jgi:hypothetical protein
MGHFALDTTRQLGLRALDAIVEKTEELALVLCI